MSVNKTRTACENSTMSFEDLQEMLPKAFEQYLKKDRYAVQPISPHLHYISYCAISDTATPSGVSHVCIHIQEKQRIDARFCAKTDCRSPLRWKTFGGKKMKVWIVIPHTTLDGMPMLIATVSPHNRPQLMSSHVRDDGVGKLAWFYVSS